jgi:hypothetical protein
MGFQTTCTGCDGQLYLVSWSSTAYVGDVPIKDDGFEPAGNTDNEIVECGDCHARTLLGYVG